MCGIFGILSLSPENIYRTIIDGLVQLQNRGYDSSGLCVLRDGGFDIHKYASTVEHTSIQILSDLNLQDTAYVGIGHNRWATHGGKTDQNSHPHVSNDGLFAIVHNGIIENYQSLKSVLITYGYKFYSQTDTEVIVNLVSYYFSQCGDVVLAIKHTIAKLHGTYGLIIIYANDPNTLYCIKNGSPILVGEYDQGAIVTSEQSGFCNRVNNYIILGNDDICVIHKNGLNKITVKTSHTYFSKPVNYLQDSLTPYPYTHWTLKEIYDQPTAILNAINRGGRIQSVSEVKLGGLEAHIDFFRKVDNIIILGCGTSLHAGLYGMHYLKTLCHFNTVQVFDGAEFQLSDIPKVGKTVCVLISQSGETKDLHRCIDLFKTGEHNIFTVGIVNVVDSLIAREVDCGIYCNAGKEIGVASTKSFTSQVICLALFAIWNAQIRGLNISKRTRMIHDLHNLSNDFQNIIENVADQIKTIVLDFVEYRNIFLLGKGPDEVMAKEGALKIKEISYIHAEAYSASALKHGPFALLDESFPTIILDGCEEHRAKILNCLEEVHSRKSPIVFITNSDFKDDRCKIVPVLHNNMYFSSLINIIPIQLFSYYMSVCKHINPDIPKNLAKVVTVE
jgi:glucosamine--fructose-6-phosphate aminotransferase (isomerizing)